MSAAKTLDDLYLDELQHLLSANDQMRQIVRLMAARVRGEDLAGMLSDAVQGIGNHMIVLEQLIEGCDIAEFGGERCKGMEGLVEEARERVLADGIGDDLRAISAIAQFRRMSHYGIAGFGTARDLAETLGRDRDAVWLGEMLDDICGADRCAIELARSSVGALA